MSNSSPRLSIILPSKNEAVNLRALLPRLREQFPEAEILLVDDGSQDDTAALVTSLALDVRRVAHPLSLGNGAAVKTGARQARGEILVFMDADGQHDPADIPRLLEPLEQGYLMAVGARLDRASQASGLRWLANGLYNRLASWMVGHRVLDLTSGFRAVRARHFQRFLYILPNGFSYPSTITMAFFRAGYPLCYVPVSVHKRQGKSHIRPLRDGVRFLLIILRITTLYSPLKVFFPVSFLLFLTGLGYYVYTFANWGRFTNMSALLFMTSILAFLIGLVSEQITGLIYRDE